MNAQITDAKVANFRTLFESVCNQSNWKLPTKEFVTLNRQAAEEMRDAIVFFVGGAEVRSESIPVQHPEGLVTFQATGYIVTSKGYYHYVGA